jgi:hypothetical protein
MLKLAEGAMLRAQLSPQELLKGGSVSAMYLQKKLEIHF